jgi:predicted ATPase
MTEPLKHPYQLRRIELRDFKSVGETSVDLKPLTVVVGANSSGKSTLLQSILSVAQAVRSRTSSAEFPLNGEFVRLGTFEETRNFQASSPDRPMQVSFRLVTGHVGGKRPLRRPPQVSRSATRPGRAILEFGWSAYLVDPPGDEETRGGFAQIDTLQVEVARLDSESGDWQSTLTCDLSGIGETLDDLGTEIFFGRGSRFSPSDPPVPVSGRVTDWTSGSSTGIDAVVMSGGVPQSLMRSVKKFEYAAETWWNVVEELFREEIEDSKRPKSEAADRGDKKLNLEAVERAHIDFASVDLIDGDESSPDSPIGREREMFGFWMERHWYRDLGKLTQADRKSIARSMVELGEAQFRQNLRERLSGEPWVDETVLVEHKGLEGDLLWHLGFEAHRFFNDGVRYLGPLREAPHVLYDPGPSKLDLGVNGEYSAAVLHAQAHSKIVMPTSDGNGQMKPLSEALDHWLREFGLADSARSQDRGRMGIGLRVTPRGLDRDVDLTAVGVGVSQILPVILLCLLASPGTLVVLEQPELHLHPRLEQKLADFLLACVRSGRQLVVETHSEHLVNRLRYRVASDPTDATHDLIRLVFAESDQGVTSYREPEINSYGGLGEDWPAGFLDLGAREAQELVRESLAKRRRSTESG